MGMKINRGSEDYDVLASKIYPGTDADGAVRDMHERLTEAMRLEERERTGKPMALNISDQRGHVVGGGHVRLASPNNPGLVPLWEVKFVSPLVDDTRPLDCVLPLEQASNVVIGFVNAMRVGILVG